MSSVYINPIGCNRSPLGTFNQGGKINANVSPITKTLALSYKDNGSYDVVVVQLGQSVPSASVAVSRNNESSFSVYHNTQAMEKLYIAVGW